MSGHAHDAISIKQEIRKYLLVFFALGLLTIITVGISYIHLPITQAVTLALIVAGIKAFLVAGFFMHLISERQSIYALLTMTIILFVGILLLPLGTHSDYLTGTVDLSKKYSIVNQENKDVKSSESADGH